MSVDTLLQEREADGRPIHVGMVGAGATGRAIALQLGTPVPGIRLVALANRTQAHAERAFQEADITEWSRVGSAREAEAEIARGRAVLTEDPMVLTACGAIDVIVEVTGTVEPAAYEVLDAFDHGKHVVMVNAELDSLLGPILKVKADQAGVVVRRLDRQHLAAQRRRREREQADVAAEVQNLVPRPRELPHQLQARVVVRRAVSHRPADRVRAGRVDDHQELHAGEGAEATDLPAPDERPSGPEQHARPVPQPTPDPADNPFHGRASLARVDQWDPQPGGGLRQGLRRRLPRGLNSRKWPRKFYRPLRSEASPGQQLRRQWVKSRWISSRRK